MENNKPLLFRHQNLDIFSSMISKSSSLVKLNTDDYINSTDRMQHKPIAVPASVTRSVH